MWIEIISSSSIQGYTKQLLIEYIQNALNVLISILCQKFVLLGIHVFVTLYHADILYLQPVVKYALIWTISK